MGDIIHTLPAVTDASNAIPDILFDWVVEETFSEIPKWHPFVRHIIPIKLRSWKNKWYKFHTWKEYYHYINQLQEKKYDIIIDAQGLLKTSIFVTSIARGIKHGMDYKSSTEPISCWFYKNNPHYIHKTQHAIERIRQLFSYSLQYSIPSCLGKYNIQYMFKSQTKKSSPYLIFLHSTTHIKKHWPESYWNTIAQYAINAGYNIKLPFWTQTEELRSKRLKSNFNQIILLPRLTLNQIAIQIMESKAIISVDTGLSHLAAALEHPNLTLYGPTDPKLIGTYGPNQTILRSETKEMKHLDPIFVWSKVLEKL